MDVVYKMTNISRLENNTPPYYYIGSKTSCTFDGKFIYDRYGKKYLTSSKSVILKEDVKKDILKFEIILTKVNDDGVEITEYERHEQLKIDKETWVNEYYNKAYAISGFTTNGYANYHYGDNELVSLPTDHHDVIDGIAIAQHSGRVISDEERIRLKERTHPSELMDWSETLTGHKKKNKTNYFKPKSEKHKKNIAKSKHKVVEMLDKDMNHVNFFKSIDEASQKSGVGRNSISACCNGRSKTAHGYIWRFIELSSSMISVVIY